MKIGILGSGVVGKVLAGGFMKHGHEVMLGTRYPDRLAQWSRENHSAKIASATQTAQFAELVVLAVKGSAALLAVRDAGVGNLDGKIVIDSTNPIADAPPTNGVLKFFTSLDKSLMEQLQAEFPRVRFVKAFNSVGNARMVNPEYVAGRPTMFICGNDAPAKQTVARLLDQFGWETEDMGMVEAARAIEPLCMLWCIRGLLHNEWGHAFKLLK